MVTFDLIRWDVCFPSGWSSSGQTGGAFIPIHLLSSHHRSAQLSVKVLPSPLATSCSPAMTVKFLGPPPQVTRPRSRFAVPGLTDGVTHVSRHDVSPQRDGCPLSPFQQRVVCSALLHGVSQASRRYQKAPQKIQSWIQKREQRCSQTWFWSTEKLAEWLLVQREQQLTVSEETLVQMAREALGDVSEPSCYNWVLDFLLRHKLGLNRSAVDRGQRPCGSLPRSIMENSRAFVKLVSPQVSQCV